MSACGLLPPPALQNKFVIYFCRGCVWAAVEGERGEEEEKERGGRQQCEVAAAAATLMRGGRWLRVARRWCGGVGEWERNAWCEGRGAGAAQSGRAARQHPPTHTMTLPSPPRPVQIPHHQPITQSPSLASHRDGCNGGSSGSRRRRRWWRCSCGGCGSSTCRSGRRRQQQWRGWRRRACGLPGAQYVCRLLWLRVAPGRLGTPRLLSPLPCTLHTIAPFPTPAPSQHVSRTGRRRRRRRLQTSWQRCHCTCSSASCTLCDDPAPLAACSRLCVLCLLACLLACLLERYARLTGGGSFGIAWGGGKKHISCALTRVPYR